MTVLKARINGQWLAVSGGGAGADEVFVGPTDPITTIPSAELWYDTDAPDPGVLTDQLRWYTSWGVVAVGLGGNAGGEQSTSLAALAADTVITPSITANLVNGRRYRVVFASRAWNPNADNTLAKFRVTLMDGAAAISNDRWTLGTGLYQSLSTSWLIEGNGASHTFTAKAGGPPNVAVTVRVNEFYIEDVGAIGAPPAVIPSPPPSWNALPLNGTWVGYGGHQPPQYRVIGDMVYARGLVTAPAGASTTIALLPVGCRPAQPQVTFALSATGVVRLDINPSGTIVALYPPTNYEAYVSLAQLPPFSVTA